MIYVGIDIAKLNHFASAISSDGEVLLEPFKFTNDNGGFQKLISSLDSFEKNSLIIGLESTAHYGNNLVEFLVSKHYKVCVINPIQTSSMRKNNIRKTKTDKVDTFIIAKTLMMQSPRFFTTQDINLMHLKNLGRFRQKIVKQRTRLTIPGIGYINGGMILGEIGDINRFSDPSKLLAFAGLDPSIYQSGNFNASHTRMSKRGSRILRYALVNAAHNVVKNNITFKAYYDAKKSEGRSHYNVLGHCAGKLVRIIYKMLTDELEFNLD